MFNSILEAPIEALGPHAIFILIAYGGVAIVTLALIIFNILAYQKQKSRLNRLKNNDENTNLI